MSMMFVGGLQRSGTTLVGRLLAAHAQITGLTGTPTNEDEGQFVQSVYLDDHAMGNTGWRRHGSAMRWAYHPAAHLTEVDAAVMPDARASLEASWAPYWAEPSARIRVEKSPSNLTRTRFLQAVFPESSFVIVTRHPVIQALAIRKWAPVRYQLGFGFDRFIDHWLVAMETFAEDQGMLRRVEMIAFEHLERDPNAVMSSLLQPFGFTTDGIAMPEFREVATPYERYWGWMTIGGVPFAPLSTPRGVLQKALQPIERIVAPVVGRRGFSRLVQRFERRVSRFGYSFEHFRWRP